MNDWADQHGLPAAVEHIVAQCQTICLGSACLFLSVVLLLLCNCRSDTERSIRSTRIVLGMILLAAACAPAVERLLPFLRSSIDPQAAEAFLARGLSVQAALDYCACVIGLAVLGYVTFSRRLSVRTALIGLASPLIVLAISLSRSSWG